jgi:hypothetical protein
MTSMVTERSPRTTTTEVEAMRIEFGDLAAGTLRAAGTAEAAQTVGAAGTIGAAGTVEAVER